MRARAVVRALCQAHSKARERGNMKVNMLARAPIPVELTVGDEALPEQPSGSNPGGGGESFHGAGGSSGGGSADDVGGSADDVGGVGGVHCPRPVRQLPSGHAEEVPRPQQRLYFVRPPWSWSKASRACLALMINFAFWVGMYNLVDYIFIPWVISIWHGDINGECTAVQTAVGLALRVGLILVGCAGLYVTGALYGEHSVKVAAFSRMG